ncbi:nucleoside hydrolase [Bacillus sp. 2205SS5-2]|uniref:nucleoside hydrolase n=1 Tax=Bacillus sp. 2205SS5-2 TaxID=3109031 RepID=UPI0030041224
MARVRKKVLFFGDVGIDDTIALIYAHLKEEIELVGIVADYGNVDKVKTTRNVRYVLDQLNSLHIKVIGGAEVPMTSLQPDYFPNIHGSHGLGPIEPSADSSATLENFFEVINLIQSTPNLTIVNTGRLTSLATLALLAPKSLKNIEAFYLMGGAFLVPGNVSPVAEANFYGDPIAANIIMKYGHNVHLFPLDVTMKAIVTPEMANFIHEQRFSPLVKPLLDFYYNEFYSKMYPKIEGSPVHDALTLLAITNKDMFTFYESAVVISTSEVTKGQSVGDFRSSIQKEVFDDRPTHKIAIDFAYEDFYFEFMSVMTGIDMRKY